jgi:hypothetical protein
MILQSMENKHVDAADVYIYEFTITFFIYN